MPTSRMKLLLPRSAILVILVLILVAIASFSETLWELVRRWSRQEEYSHGFLIPAVAAWLLWTRRDALLNSIGPPSWIGVVVILLAGAMHVVGGLGALYILSQVGFVLALMGGALCFGGISFLKVTFIPIVFLLFAIPLPYFVDAMLSYRLQLISSELGVFVIRLFQVPVYLEGNVIDLGTYKLQVVDACSGLRYLYPLLSLGFLAAYLFQAPIWQRVVVFLSAIPITIAMNSFRIGMVGILVDQWGPQDADGLLHMFEGWIIFIACSLLLLGEMYVLTAVVSRRKFFDVLRPPDITAIARDDMAGRPLLPSPLIAGFMVLCTAGIFGAVVSHRQEVVPDRTSFAGFPSTLGEWRGRTSTLETQIEQGLGLTDYVLSDFRRSDGRLVNLYVAYYASQRNGLSPHSPAVCIPGNGWQITTLDRSNYSDETQHLNLPLNRVVIQKGSDKQLVYYWFEQRGRKIANEWVSKYYLLRDAIFQNRTDGALVRLTTPVYPGEDESHADKRLRAFTDQLLPGLSGYLPSEAAREIKPASIQPIGGQS